MSCSTRLCARSGVFNPARAFGFDDQRTNRALITVLDWVGRDQVRPTKLDRSRDSLEAVDNNVAGVPLVPGDAAWSNCLVWIEAHVLPVAVRYVVGEQLWVQANLIRWSHLISIEVE